MGLRKYILPVSFSILVLALCMNVVLTSTKYLKGDGYEYLLMAESFSNHGSPGATIADISSISQKIKMRGYPSPIDEPIFNDYLQMLQGGSNAMGYFKANNNHYYSYHFWLYSLVNLPALYLTKLFSLAPVRAFLITNLVIFIGTLWFLWNTALLSPRERLFISAFYIFSGTTYYLDWSHPEVYSASLLVVGLIYLLRNKLLPAALLMALAAQQNPPIAVVALAVVGWQGLRDLRKLFFSSTKLKDFLLALVPLSSIFLLLLWAPLFYLWRFGTPSLIVSSGAASNHFISAARLFSLFFDLNQGMVVAIPCVFLLGMLGMFNVLFHRQWKDFFLAALMLGICLMLAVPVLTTGNWNSGQSIILRYAYWVSMPLGLSVMLLLNSYSARFFKLLFALFFLGQVCLLLTYRISGREDTMQMKALPAYLLENKPAWYNPVPAILVKRNIENAVGAESQYVYYYVNWQGVVTKILYHEGSEQWVLPFCNNQSLGQLKSQSAFVSTEDGWGYLNQLGAACKISVARGLYRFS